MVRGCSRLLPIIEAPALPKGQGLKFQIKEGGVLEVEGT